jgi:2-polyprenyl-3-methyl-5-hydroxy-6-metoxy-1,4-benzoquinol methylase
MNKKLQENRKKASDQSLGLSDQRLYQIALNLIDKYCQPKSHMDFGCGQGQFLKILAKHFEGVELTGVDLMDKPTDFDIKINWCSADLNNDLPFKDELFNSLTAIEVIEHLENPRHIFRELYRVIKKEGILILSTPNNESWRSLFSFIMRDHFVAFTDSSYPAHITALNRKDLKRAAQEAGFEYLDCVFSSHGSIPAMTHLSWQKVSMGILDGLRYSDNLFMIFKK